MAITRGRAVKDKKKILFSKCEVIVSKMEDKSLGGHGISSGAITFKRGESITTKKDDRIVGTSGQKWHKKYKCLSPLGFYYYKNKSSIEYNRTYDEIGVRQKHIIYLSDGYYEITYLRQMNGTTIGHETRPWDLVGNGIEDHLVNDLQKLLTNLIGSLECEGYKSDKLREFKNDLFIDLFGSPEGMKTQTNELKILSHGFDLKESFRKRKEQ